MCWLQGEEHKSLPSLNRECIKRWRSLNPDWNVIVLTKKTIADYVPEYKYIINNAPKRSRQLKSDLLRILLLEKYGGVWVDASVFPMRPLSNFYIELINGTGFFAYRFMPRSVNKKKGDREIASWFLCASASHKYLITQWENSFIEKFTSPNKLKYWELHDTISKLFDEDPAIRETINNMEQLSESIAHSAMYQNRYKKTISSFVYKRPRKKFAIKHKN